jgi:hypothetical protein
MRHSSLFFIVIMCMGLFVTGCKAPGLTKEQVHMRHADSVHQNMLQFQDDIDSFFLIDRPSRLSPMLVR